MHSLNITTGEQAVSYIHSFSWLGSRPGLARTQALLSAIGNPERALTFVHIVGTNGKGSTSAMIASILTAAGYRTGLYTSPYLRRFHERIMADGQEIPDDDLAAITAFVGAHADAMADHPTEFELVTCIALEYYRRQGCRFVVLEAGLGGRLDSTNAIPAPAAVVLTNIGLDHTQQLGSTAETIAAEKAAVIKPGCQVVLYRQEPGVMRVVQDVCSRQAVPLSIAGTECLAPLSDSLDGQIFSWQGLTLSLPLLGTHQLHNAAVALTTISTLRKRFPISDQAVQEGLAQVRWPGRFEVLSRSPWFIVDGGHNPQCAQSVANSLAHYFPGQKITFLMGVLEDKDYSAVCSCVLPLAKTFVTVTPPSPRARSAQALADTLTALGASAHPCASIPDGIELALRLAGPDGVVCAFGSLYSVGDIRAFFGLE